MAKVSISDKVRRLWGDLFSTAIDRDVEGMGFQIGDRMTDLDGLGGTLTDLADPIGAGSGEMSTRDLPQREMEAYMTDAVQLNRRQRYISFDNLEDIIPEVKVALDTYAEESCNFDQDGHCFHVICNNQQIKEELEWLWFSPKMLNADRNIYGRTRNACKYGEGFWELVTDPQNPQYGILAVNELDPYTMWRIQTRRGKLLEFQQTRLEPDYDCVRQEIASKYNKTKNPAESLFWSWRQNISSSSGRPGIIRFAPAQVVHLRLGGGEKKQYGGYGTSVLDSARRPAYNLRLLEDSLLLYRLVRAPERRVYYVDLGQAQGNKVEAFLKDFRNNVKRKKIVDDKTGQISERYNPWPVRRTTPVPLLDGRTLTIEEIAREYEAGKENLVHSVLDGPSGKVVPGKVVWCGKNYHCENLVRVWIDDGGYVDVAPEHPFVLRDGTSRRADELQPGDSVMPLYTRLCTENDEKSIVGYPMVLDNENNSSYAAQHATPLNHQVTKVECLVGETDDVYCMTVHGPNGERDRHNFAVQELGVDHVSCLFVRNSVDDDLFIPIRPGSGTRVETLPGAQNLSDIEDAFYFRRKFYLSLGVPPGYMEQTVESQTTRFMLSALNVRFATRVYRIQREMADAIREISVRHLQLQGVPESLWEDLKIVMTPPSEWREAAMMEILNNRANLALSIKNLGVVDDDWIRMNVMKLTEEQNSDQRRKFARQELEKAELEAQKSMIQARANAEIERGTKISEARLQAELAAATGPADFAVSGNQADEEEVAEPAVEPNVLDGDPIPSEEELAAVTPDPNDQFLGTEDDFNDIDDTVDRTSTAPRRLRPSQADIEAEREGI